MKAVLVAAGWNSAAAYLSELRPPELFPLGDRSFLQHAIELLVQFGVTHIDFILSHLPEKFEALIGDGSRWGITVEFHLASSSERPYRHLRSIATETGEEFWLAHADRLPNLPSHSECPAGTIAFCTTDDEPMWTGWARLRAEDANLLRIDGDEQTLGESLLQITNTRGRMESVECRISAKTGAQYIDSQRALLQKQGPNQLLLGGRETQAGIWISRNVSLHPTVRLEAPLFIGENSRIEIGVALGPNAVIGSGCVVDARTQIRDSVILPGTYVGQMLEPAQVVIDRNRLANVRLQTSIAVSDSFLLGRMLGSGPNWWLRSVASRCTAVLLLALFWPVIALIALGLKLFRKGQVVRHREAVHLPTDSIPEHWRTFDIPTFRNKSKGFDHELPSFWLEFLPALIPIAAGRLHFVGVPPRSREDIRALPRDWRTLYMSAKAGIISEASVRCGAAATEDDLYSADMFYAATCSLAHDFHLLAVYLKKALLPSPRLADNNIIGDTGR